MGGNRCVKNTQTALPSQCSGVPACLYVFTYFPLSPLPYRTPNRHLNACPSQMLSLLYIQDQMPFFAKHLSAQPTSCWQPCGQECSRSADLSATVPPCTLPPALLAPSGKTLLTVLSGQPFSPSPLQKGCVTVLRDLEIEQEPGETCGARAMCCLSEKVADKVPAVQRKLENLNPLNRR